MEKILITYLVFINFYGLLLMYLDKRKSIKGKWRIPEANLFGTAILFGSIGILSGMYLFRHKTKHWRFIIIIPALLLIQIFIFYKFIYTSL